MESSEFGAYLEKFPSVKKFFDGTCSIDTIPRNLKVNHYVICNTDISTGKGKHWFVLYRITKDILECFDSLGINDEKKYTLLSACKFNVALTLKVNTTQIQLETSSTCGKFCLMFIIDRAHTPDIDFDDFLNSTFTDNCFMNEKILEEFFETVVT